MLLNRRTLLSGLAATLAMPAIIGRAQAQTPVITASLLADDKPETLIWTFIRDRLEEELPGAFAFNIVPNAALGGERQVLENIKLNSIQASIATLSSLSAWAQQAQLFDLPFLFRDAAHQQAALAGEHGIALQETLSNQGLITPSFIWYGARHLLGTEPLTTPETMRGKRIRVIESPLHATLWESFAAHPVAMPITETYDALSTGRVDCMDLTISAYAGFRLHEVVGNVTKTGHIHAAGAVVFSAPFWNGLTEDQRAVLSAVSAEGAQYFNDLMAEDESKSAQAVIAEGAVFHEVEDRAAWEIPAHAVWDMFADRVGGLDTILAVRDLA